VSQKVRHLVVVVTSLNIDPFDEIKTKIGDVTVLAHGVQCTSPIYWYCESTVEMDLQQHVTELISTGFAFCSNVPTSKWSGRNLS